MSEEDKKPWKHERPEFWRTVALEMVVDTLELQGFHKADEMLENVYRRFDDGSASYADVVSERAGAELLAEFEQRCQQARFCRLLPGRPCTAPEREPLPCDFDAGRRCAWCDRVQP